MTEKNHHFPNAPEATALLVLLVLFEIALSSTVQSLFGGIGLNPLDTAGMVTLVANAVMFTGLMHYKGMSYSELFHSASGTTRDWQVVLAGVLMTAPALVAGMIVLLDVVRWLVPLSALQVLMFEEMGAGTFGAIMLACVLAPVLEEMLFRGVILRSFLQQYGKWPAIVGSAFMFGVAHMNIYQFFVGLILGTFLGWLYQRTRSLLPCIFLHVLYNGTLTVMQQRGLYLSADAGELFGLAALMLFFGVQGLALLHRTMPQQP
jgi:membrane protease YdiL (CAAX protease family)